jgi:DNA-binding beta-propeller fold protein YncE
MAGDLRSIVGALAGLVLSLLASSSAAVAPLPVEARVPAKVTGTLAVPDLGMHMPTDVAVDSRGDVYVADGARDRLVVFAPDGKVRAATTRPVGQALKRPVGLTVDAKDRLWIADTGAHRLVVLSPRAEQLVEVIDLPQVDAKHPAGPTGIAVAADLSRTYVADNANHRLLVRDNASGRVTPVGQAGGAVGQFQYPFHLAAGAAGDVYITEAIGARVQILTAQDRWAGTIGSWGVELGQFYRPKGIAVDAGGRVFVGDSTLGVVQVCNARGRVTGCLTGADGRPLRFEHPMGMAFDKSGRLYVVELAANRVAVVTLDAVGGAP